MDRRHAAAVLAEAPAGAAATLAMLATGYDATFELPTGGAPLFATLYWRDGEIKAELSMSGRLDWCARGKLVIQDASLPETVVCALAGRRVDEVVELPFACPLVIEEAEEWGDGLRFELRLVQRMVDRATGRTWGGPRWS